MNTLNNINKTSIINKMDKVLMNYKNNINNYNFNILDKNIISNIKINYYGKLIYLYKLSNILLENKSIIRVVLFDRNIKNLVKKSIISYGLDLNISDDKNDILICIPPLTQDKKNNFIKLLKKETELFKVYIRNIRKKIKNKIKLLVKSINYSKDEEKNINIILQNLTDLYINNIDKLFIEKKNQLLNK